MELYDILHHLHAMDFRSSHLDLGEAGDHPIARKAVLGIVPNVNYVGNGITIGILYLIFPSVLFPIKVNMP